MEPLIEAGVEVDGVDFSERMIAFAKENPKLASCRFFVSRGNDCGAAPDAEYDVAYSQMCFRQIPSRAVRLDALQALARALRPGGVLIVQMRFFPDHTASTVPAPHVPWTGEPPAASDSAPAEMWATPDELPVIYADFARYFWDVRLQVLDLPPTPQEARPAQLIVSASTLRCLHNRVHALAAP
jgi:SAM-dependent methyltransferase